MTLYVIKLTSSIQVLIAVGTRIFTQVTLWFGTRVSLSVGRIVPHVSEVTENYKETDVRSYDISDKFEILKTIKLKKNELQIR